MKGIGGHHRAYCGRTNEWLTPPEIIDALGPFDLDPCAAVNRPFATATLHYTIRDEGLTKRWVGFVWLNPPYGPSTGPWLQKLAMHGDGIALIFARTETAMFRRWVWTKADALVFLYGRLHFLYPNGERATANAGAPSVLVGYGTEAARRLLAAVSGGSIKGKYVPLVVCPTCAETGAG